MQSWLNLSGKIIIVTGGASGIGSAIVEELITHGANVQMVKIMLAINSGQQIFPKPNK